MYIPPFHCGVIVGFVLGMVTILAFAILVSGNNKKK